MKQTALHDIHVDLGARMVEFGGWRMPVQYGPILDEVKRVRTAAGLFDLGHMGRIRVEGLQAVALVDRVATNHCAKIPVGAIRYSLFCDEDGYPLDDLLLYREEQGVYLVVNAANTEKDLAWIRDHLGDLDARVVDETTDTSMLAVQGPSSLEILRRVVTNDSDVDGLKYYRFGFGTVCGIPDVRISRTGYTGENGFELYLPRDEGPRVWHELLAAGEADGLRPIGLGARDTLRLEAGMPLYGHEIDDEHHPLEAGLAFGIAFTDEKGDFVGRAALEARRESTTRQLVGVTTDGPRVPRQGYPLFQGSEEVGVICSGSISPTIGTKIATAYVKLGLDGTGEKLEIGIRDKRQACTVCELPFYSRTRNSNQKKQ